VVVKKPCGVEGGRRGWTNKNPKEVEEKRGGVMEEKGAWNEDEDKDDEDPEAPEKPVVKKSNPVWKREKEKRKEPKSQKPVEA
jgi:hypothetical protein